MFNKPVLCITLFISLTFALPQGNEQSKSSSVQFDPSAQRPNFDMELVRKPYYRVFSKPLVGVKTPKTLPKRFPPRPKKVPPASPPSPPTGTNTTPQMEISEVISNSASLTSTAMLQEQELKKANEVAYSGLEVKPPTTQRTTQKNTPKKVDILLERISMNDGRI